MVDAHIIWLCNIWFSKSPYKNRISSFGKKKPSVFAYFLSQPCTDLTQRQ